MPGSVRERQFPDVTGAPASIGKQASRPCRPDARLGRRAGAQLSSAASRRRDQSRARFAGRQTPLPAWRARGARKCGSTTRKTNERVGFAQVVSAHRSKLRTRSASPARPVSTMIGSSGSIREASPSAARTRSRTSSPLPPSSRRSSSTRQGRRTSIARSPSAALEALDTRNPSAARLSARKPWWPRRPRSRGSAPARPHPKKDCAGEARPGCTGVGGCCEPASGRNDKKNGRRERGR
jgi:hypothetical protein